MPPDPPKVKQVTKSIIHCSLLLELAAKSAERCGSTASSVGTDEFEPLQEDSIAAILFSAAAIEAFINEITIDCKNAIGSGDEDEVLRRFAFAMLAAEDSKSSTKNKIELAHILLTNEKPNLGGNPFADFAHLFGLRNDIMHIKGPSSIGLLSDEATSSMPRRVESLRQRGLTRKLPDGGRTFWVFHLMSAQVAWWACDTAAAICLHIAELVPRKEVSESFASIFSEYSQEWRSRRPG